MKADPTGEDDKGAEVDPPCPPLTVIAGGVGVLTLVPLLPLVVSISPLFDDDRDKLEGLNADKLVKETFLEFEGDELFDEFLEAIFRKFAELDPLDIKDLFLWWLFNPLVG